jgi:hypothetical protein
MRSAKGHVPAIAKLWIVGRARSFRLDRGREVFSFSYRAICRNLERARGIRVSHETARQIVHDEDPELARRRGAVPGRLGRPKRRRHRKSEDVSVLVTVLLEKLDVPIPSAAEIRQAFERGLQVWNDRAMAIRAGTLPPPAKTLREALDRVRLKKKEVGQG